MAKELKDNEITNPNWIISTLDKWIQLIEKNSIFKIFKALLVMVMCVIIFYLLFTPQKIFDVFERISQHTHQQRVELRLEADRTVKAEIRELMYKANADRVFVLEMRNSTNNLAGLPFLYLDMKFEEVGDFNIESIDHEYQSINISKYPIMMQLQRDNMFIGSIEELAEIDPKLAYKMTGNGAKYVALIFLEGSANPVGVLGLTYQNTDIDKTLIRKALVKASTKITLALDRK